MRIFNVMSAKFYLSNWFGDKIFIMPLFNRKRFTSIVILGDDCCYVPLKMKPSYLWTSTGAGIFHVITFLAKIRHGIMPQPRIYLIQFCWTIYIWQLYFFRGEIKVRYVHSLIKSDQIDSGLSICCKLVNYINSVISGSKCSFDKFYPWPSQKHIRYVISCLIGS